MIRGRRAVVSSASGEIRGAESFRQVRTTSFTDSLSYLAFCATYLQVPRLSRIRPHQFALRKHMPLHRPLQLILGEPGGDVERRVEGVEAKEVAVRTLGRRRSAITDRATG